MALDVAVRSLPDANDHVTEKAVDDVSQNRDVLPMKLRNEFVASEPVLRRMAQKGSIRPARQRLSSDFLEKESSARLEDASDLGHRRAPVGHVVNHAEIEHCVERVVLRWNGGSVRNTKPHLFAVISGKPTSSLVDERGIEIERRNRSRLEPVQDDFGADAAAATYFKDVLAFSSAAQSF